MAEPSDIPSASAEALMSKPRNERRSAHIGAKLREAREASDLSLEEVAKKIRIRETHLLALEQLDVGALPGRAYAIGFLRAYAEFLELDADDCVRRFKIESAARAPAPEERRYEFPQPSGRPSFAPGSSIILIAVVLFAGVWGGWQLTRPSTDDLYLAGADVYGPGTDDPDAPLFGDDPLLDLGARPASFDDAGGRAIDEPGVATSEAELFRERADVMLDLNDRRLRSDALVAAERRAALAEEAEVEAPLAAVEAPAPSPTRSPAVESAPEPSPAPEPEPLRETASVTSPPASSPEAREPAAEAAIVSGDTAPAAAESARSAEEDDIARAIAAGLAALEAERLEAERAAEAAVLEAAAAQDAAAAAQDAADAAPASPTEAVNVSSEAEAEAPNAGADEPGSPALPSPTPQSPTPQSPTPQSPTSQSAAPEPARDAAPANVAASEAEDALSQPAPPPAPPAAAEPAGSQAAVGAAAVTGAQPISAISPADVESPGFEEPEAVGEPAAEDVAEAQPLRTAPALPQGDIHGDEPQEARVIVRAVIPGYLRVIDENGVVLLNKELNTGDLFYAPGNRTANLTVYNAAGFDVIVDGDYKGRLGQPGEGKTNMSLDPAYLRELLP